MKHNVEDLSIYKLVQNRLPFLEDTEPIRALVSNFTWEVMIELENCFRVDLLPMDEGTTTNVGDETKYSAIQKIIIADLVSCYMILYLRSRESFGNGSLDTNTEVPTFMSKAKAGSVEVEWDKASFAGFGSYDVDALFDQLKASAIRKAYNIGCIIEWTDDLIAQEMEREHTLPLKVFTSGCGCNNKKPVERG